MKKSNTNEAEKIEINPSLEVGELIDNRYELIEYKKMLIDGKIISPGRGYCCDLFDNEKLYSFI